MPGTSSRRCSSCGTTCARRTRTGAPRWSETLPAKSWRNTSGSSCGEAWSICEAWRAFEHLGEPWYTQATLCRDKECDVSAVASEPTYTPEELLLLPDGGKGFEL